jgi:thymidylate kinase
MIIAFTGNSGSGKTTISREMLRFFSDLGFEAIYKDEYPYVVLGFLFKLIGQEKIEKHRNEMLVQNKRSVTYTLWPTLVWFDLLVQYIYFRIFKRRSVVIFDRYPYDYYLEFKYLGILTTFTEWLYLHFPKPDVHVMLAVSPEIAYERKKNDSRYYSSFYKKEVEEYLELARILGSTVINTNKNIQSTVMKVIQKCYQSSRVSKGMYQKRRRTEQSNL